MLVAVCNKLKGLGCFIKPSKIVLEHFGAPTYIEDLHAIKCDSSGQSRGLYLVVIHI